METVAKEHDLDIETIMASRLTLAAGEHSGDPASQQITGSSQQAGAAEEGKSGNEVSTPETDASPKALTGPGSGGRDMYQGSVAHISVGVVESKAEKTMDHGGSSAATNANPSLTSMSRNRLMPKKLPLGIAHGNIDSKEDGTHGDLTDPKGKEQSVHDSSSEVPTLLETTDSSKGHTSA